MTPFHCQPLTLCRPDHSKSCFRCCPPIRPAGYDHWDHRGILRREFIQNTRDLEKNKTSGRPIIGYSCWALGFLDEKHRLLGCLLHPAVNDGLDLRDATGYGEKCRREFCREAGIFERLSPELKTFCLGPSQGLDSFEYSSPKINPVFHLLKWGPSILARLAVEAQGELTRQAYRTEWAALSDQLVPEIDALGVQMLLNKMDLKALLQNHVLANYLHIRGEMIHKHKIRVTPPMDRGPYIHQLNLSTSEIDFLRHGLGWNRTILPRARAVVMEFEQRLGAL